MNFDVVILSLQSHNCDFAQLFKLALERYGKRIYLNSYKHDMTDEPDLFLKKIEGIPSVILIIPGKTWNVLTDSKGFYVKTIRAILKSNVKIIPVIVDSKKKISELSIAKEIRSMLRINAIYYKHENFESVIKKVLKYIDNKSINAGKVLTGIGYECEPTSYLKVNEVIRIIRKYENHVKYAGIAFVPIFGLFVYVFADQQEITGLFITFILFLVNMGIVYFLLFKPIMDKTQRKIARKVKDYSLSPEEVDLLIEKLDDQEWINDDWIRKIKFSFISSDISRSDQWQ